MKFITGVILFIFLITCLFITMAIVFNYGIAIKVCIGVGVILLGAIWTGLLIMAIYLILGGD